jgi:hypothetical protein
LEDYPQRLLDALYEEGDRDFHFLNDLLGLVGNIYPEPYMKNKINLSKSNEKLLEDALSLAGFFIGSNIYIGFYMREYGKIDRIFDTAEKFKNFILDSAIEVDYFERITTEDRYTVGLKKIQPNAKAPQITPEIAKIFVVN